MKDPNELKAERDRMREVVKIYKETLNAIDDYARNDEGISERIYETRLTIEALTPQGADTPCEECGTVGGGGTVPGGEKPYPIMNTRENKPCPRCGA